MQKKNLFSKKFNRSVLSITKRIESFFNFFSENFFKKKNLSRNFRTIDKKIFLFLAFILIFTVTYFVLPAFYDKNKIKALIENQISNEYNLEVKLDKDLKYGLFPTPHFYSENVIIKYQSNEIAKSSSAKFSIFINNFFKSSNLKVKNLNFKKTEFKINFSNFKFFVDLLNNIKSEKRINFFNSKLFYLEQNNEVVFLTNIKNLNYFLTENFLQKFESKFNIFNISTSLNTEHNVIDKKFSNNLTSRKLRLNLQNVSNYKDKRLDGELNLTIVNRNLKINYNLENKIIKFFTNDNEINGQINIKPFFLQSNLKLPQIDLKKIFENDSILLNILKSQVLNNRNLNGQINVDTNNFKGQNFLDGIKFNIILEEGSIYIQNLKTTFKESVRINVDDTQLIVDNNNLNFAGYVDLNFIDLTNFYAHYQINRNFRKNFKKIKFGFLLNLDEKSLEIDNLKIDGKSNENLDKFVNKINSNKNNLLNKIILRNSIKDFFKNF